MKVMLGGADSMFSVWLTFFREQLATYVALVVLLPLTLLLNWQLASVLIVLVVLFCVVTVVVINRTEEGQRRAESVQSSLAGTAQDALANVMVVQSFTRLAAETRRFGRIADEVIAHQFPVLNWWAVVNVLTRGASTIAVIVIVLVGTVLHVAGKASVGEIVHLHGVCQPADQPARIRDAVRRPPVPADAGAGGVLPRAGRQNLGGRAAGCGGTGVAQGRGRVRGGVVRLSRRPGDPARRLVRGGSPARWWPWWAPRARARALR